MIHDVKKINELLRKEFGDDLAGRAKFRVVWAAAQTEKQFGDFEEYYGHIFIRAFRGIKEVKKYPWIGERWILEKLVPNPARTEILVGPQSYECIYVFQDGAQNYLPAAWEVAQAIVNTLLTGKATPTSKFVDRENALIAEEAEQFSAYMEEEGPSDLSINNRLNGGVFLGRGSNAIN